WRLGVCEVEPADAGEQEFAARGGHCVEDLDAMTGRRQHFGGGQARRAGADHGDFDVGGRAHRRIARQAVHFSASVSDVLAGLVEGRRANVGVPAGSGSTWRRKLRSAKPPLKKMRSMPVCSERKLAKSLTSSE